MSRRAPSVLLLLALAVPAAAGEVPFRLAGDEGPVRVVLSDLAGGTVAVLREAPLGPAATRLLLGAGRRTRDGLEVELRAPPAAGLSGALGGAPAPPVLAVYAQAEARLAGTLRAPDGAGGWRLVREAGAAEPVAPAVYALAPAPAASDRGAPVDLARENAAVSRRLRGLTPAERARPWPVIVVPGAAPGDATTPLSAASRERAALAARALRETGALAVLVTGGNVRPQGTPFNEALELKRALLALGVPEDRIAVEPFARHTTTNLRNAGRFLLVHGVERALVITSRGQSFYVGRPWLSTFHLRCLWTLGHRVGGLRAVGSTRTAFTPSPRCLRPGRDPLDP